MWACSFLWSDSTFRVSYTIKDSISTCFPGISEILANGPLKHRRLANVTHPSFDSLGYVINWHLTIPFADFLIKWVNRIFSAGIWVHNDSDVQMLMHALRKRVVHVCGLRKRSTSLSRAPIWKYAPDTSRYSLPHKEMSNHLCPQGD